MKCCSFLHALAAVCTCAFTCTQQVSYFHIWLTFEHKMCDYEWMVLFSTCCYVNLCIHLCSDGKLLSYLVNILTQDVRLRMNGCSFLHLLLYELVHSLVLRRVSYFHILVNILTQDVCFRMNGCSFLHALAAVWTCAFTCAQVVS